MVCHLSSDRPRDWVELPFSGLRLTELAYLGGGKDADLTIRLADGREYETGVHGLSVTGSGFRVELDPVDDLSLDIRYKGTGLVIVSARVAFDDEADPDFTADVREWAASDGHAELLWVVDAEFDLTTSPA